MNKLKNIKPLPILSDKRNNNVDRVRAMNKRRHLKAAQIFSGKTQQEVSVAANQHLPAELHLTELHISQFIHGRKAPTQEQAEALAKVLNVSVSAITRRSL